MKNYKIKLSFTSSRYLPGWKKIYDFYFNILRKLSVIRYYAWFDFSVQLRTGSNPLDINQFPSHTGKKYYNAMYAIIKGITLSNAFVISNCLKCTSPKLVKVLTKVSTAAVLLLITSSTAWIAALLLPTPAAKTTLKRLSFIM